MTAFAPSRTVRCAASTKAALEPDLRHWSHIPAAFVVTNATEKADERCYHGAG
jgi:hypothetical protein